MSTTATTQTTNLPTSLLDDNKQGSDQPTRSRWWVPRRLPNPGKFEDLAREAKSTLSVNEHFDGLRFEYARVATPNLSVIHLISMAGKAEPPNYSLCANYVREDGKVLMIGRVDTEGQKMARLFRTIGDNLTVRLSLQDSSAEPDSAAASFEADYKGSDYMAQLKAMTGGVFGVSYAQSVTPRVAVGSECVYYHGQGSFLSLGGRFNTADKNTILTGSLSSMGQASFTCTQKATDYLSASSELQLALANRLHSVFAFGFDYRVSNNTTGVGGSLKARCDSQGKLSALYEERWGTIGTTVSVDCDHSKKEYKFGVGLQFQA
eukprot:TRINITY_DN642_c0_g2_i1.p1 TRINITY_DN642_c0_g2~~TRINITY_DN642_c0_g2_i1.p1  ORF type:complete len:320 (+),score=67.55 TRINITY_DN642_c0_g2_i1:163-1122(+)